MTAGEVDDDALRAVLDAVEQHLFELRRRVDVDLALEDDDADLVGRLLEVDAELRPFLHARLLGTPLGDTVRLPLRPFCDPILSEPGGG